MLDIGLSYSAFIIPTDVFHPEQSHDLYQEGMLDALGIFLTLLR